MSDKPSNGGKIPDQEFAEEVIRRLNGLIEIDKEAKLGVRKFIESLIETRLRISAAMLEDHPTIQGSIREGVPKAGFLGMLNGIAGARSSDGWGYIAASMEKNENGGLGSFIGFVVTPDHKE